MPDGDFGVETHYSEDMSDMKLNTSFTSAAHVDLVSNPGRAPNYVPTWSHDQVDER